MAKSFNWWTRKVHRWGALLIAVPLLLVICTGLLLQVKKEFAWIQPPNATGSAEVPSVSWDVILQTARSHESAAVEDWNDIDRLDVRIDKGVSKVQCKNGWELQVDSASGALLSSAYRRSDIIEDIHDGSFFSEPAKMWIFLPNGIVLLILWITGVYLWYLPVGVRRRRMSKPSTAQRRE